MAITLLRVLAAAVVILLAMQGNWAAVFVVAALGFVSDFADGYLARRWRVVSSAGAFWDPMADKILCHALLVVLALYGSQWFWLMSAIFFVYDCFTVGLRLRLAGRASMPAHSAAKLKTAALMAGLLLAVVGIMSTDSLFWIGYALVAAAAAISSVSALRYYRWMRGHVA